MKKVILMLTAVALAGTMAQAQNTSHKTKVSAANAKADAGVTTKNAASAAPAQQRAGGKGGKALNAQTSPGAERQTPKAVR